MSFNGRLDSQLARSFSCNLTLGCDGASSPVIQMQMVTEALAPVCASVYGLSGGLAGAQRACFLVRLWVLLIGITLMQPRRAQLVRQLTILIIRALFLPATALWPS